MVLGPVVTVSALPPIIQPQQDPTGSFSTPADSSLRTGSTPAPRPDRPCVLLRNDNVLFGQAHQVGQFVIVRDGQNAEVRLPRLDVACWAPSIRDLYQFRVDHRRRADLATHLGDARWCVQYELLGEADSELEAARAIDPMNPQVASIQAQIDRARSPHPPTARIVRNDFHEDQVQPVDYQSITQSIDVDLTMLKFFAANVHPTLLNRCGTCHHPTSGRPWSMVVPGTGTRASSRITRENLAASLEFVDHDSPINSALLQKAITSHGGAAPLDARHAKSVEALKIWLTAVGRASQKSSANVGSLVNDELVGADFSAPPSIARSAAPDAEHATQMASETEWNEVDPTLRRPQRVDEEPAAEQPASQHQTSPNRLPVVNDPFSPDLFNRRNRVR